MILFLVQLSKRGRTWCSSLSRDARRAAAGSDILGDTVILAVIGYFLSFNWASFVSEFETWGLIGVLVYSLFVAVCTGHCIVGLYRRSPEAVFPKAKSGELSGDSAQLVIRSSTIIAQAFLGINGFLLVGKGYFSSIQSYQYDALLATLIYVLVASAIKSSELLSEALGERGPENVQTSTEKEAQDAAQQTASNKPIPEPAEERPQAPAPATTTPSATEAPRSP